MGNVRQLEGTLEQATKERDYYITALRKQEADAEMGRAVRWWESLSAAEREGWRVRFLLDESTDPLYLRAYRASQPETPK